MLTPRKEMTGDGMFSHGKARATRGVRARRSVPVALKTKIISDSMAKGLLPHGRVNKD